jgi:putative ATP-dependent endonuclease of OLD family
MKLREIKVQNFRNLVDVAFPVGDTTVLLGENNTGKSALLDALRAILSRTTAIRGQTFDEYDYHMEKAGDSPQQSQGILIELWFREDSSDEWPESVVQALTEIIQTDPETDIDSIGLRLTSKFDAATNQFVPKLEFLNLEGEPLGGKGADNRNFPRFLEYARFYYLSALRDAEKEFSARSSYWGRILRDLKLTDAQKKSIAGDLAKLNAALLKADPRIEQVRASLDNVQKVMAVDSKQNASIQAIPLKPWELMSKSEVVMRGRGSEIDFPLSRHGQGMQSLAVLYLFQAYLDVLLKSIHKPETEAILALEEPEAHLHPQAVRALSANLTKLKSQKILSTHSPYFVQEIPFTQIRMLRRNGPAAKVLYVKRAFELSVEELPALEQFCSNNSQKFEYRRGKLIAKGCIGDGEYRTLLGCYPGQPAIHQQLKALCDESQEFLTDRELFELDTYVKRMRGDIMFARVWLLCEGQSEYLLFRFFADLLDTPLDRAGVAVIDFQNNGSPGAFVGLARCFQIPWLMVCDNDAAGKTFVKQVRERGATDPQIRPLPDDGMDLELFLAKNGFEAEYTQLLAARRIALTKKSGQLGFVEEVAAKVRGGDKVEYVAGLIEKLRQTGATSTRVPKHFADAIVEAIKLAK